MAREYIFNFGLLDVVDTDEHQNVVTCVHDVSCTVVETDDQGEEIGRAYSGVVACPLGAPGPSFAVAISMDDDRDAAVAQRLGWLTDEQIQGRKDAADRRLDAPVQRQIA